MKIGNKHYKSNHVGLCRWSVNRIPAVCFYIALYGLRRVRVRCFFPRCNTSSDHYSNFLRGKGAWLIQFLRPLYVVVMKPLELTEFRTLFISQPTTGDHSSTVQLFGTSF